MAARRPRLRRLPTQTHVHKLLIVPDDILSLELRDSFLDRRGVRARSALSGEEALAIAMVWEPSLVVFGSVLPDMAAAAFVTRLRSGRVGPRLLLIRVTRSVGEDVAELPDELYDAHLVAPVDGHQLLDTAAALLDLRQRRWPRVRANFTVVLTGMLEKPGPSGRTPATTVDLSEGGMRLEPRDPLVVGSSGTVELVLPGSATRLVLPATVRALVDEVQLHYGIEFSETTDQQRQMLRSFVELRLPRREPA